MSHHQPTGRKPGERYPGLKADLIRNDVPPPPEIPPEMQNLSPAQRMEVASRILARRNLIHFIKRFKPNYIAGWVHEDIARRLERFSQDVVQKKSPRLMILMPPRHGKSEMASVRFPAWHLGHCPDHEIINCGYNMDLPMRFSRWVREIVREKSFQVLFENCVIDPESQSAEAWNTLMGGGFTAAGVGGGITGKGAHILIIDDPIKNQEEADSILTRDNLWSWYWSTAYTRLAPGGGVLVIQTWWNDDDLAGRLQAEGLEKFDVVRYPALAEAWEYEDSEGAIQRFETEQSDSTLKFLRAPGEALHEDRYSRTMLENYRANMPARTWSALYQQNPVPDEGMFFQKAWLKHEAVAPALYQRNIFQAWDFAFGTKQTNDYTVGVTLIQDEHDNLHIVDIDRFRGDTYEVASRVLDAVVKWGSELTCPLTLGFEEGQHWLALKPTLEKLMSERRVYPPYELLKTLTDKMTRARSLQGRLQQGRVWFPESAPWLREAVQELLRFPAGAHDDVVDALAHAANLCLTKTPKHVPVRRNRLKSWREKLPGVVSGDGSHMSA